jgi:hypothetical protein
MKNIRDAKNRRGTKVEKPAAEGMPIIEEMPTTMETPGKKWSQQQQDPNSKTNKSINAKKESPATAGMPKKKKHQQWCTRNRRDVNNSRTSTTAEWPTTAGMLQTPSTQLQQGDKQQ